MTTAERVMLFIDANNIYGHLKELQRRSKLPIPEWPDFQKLSRLLAKHRKIIRSFFYIGIFDPIKEPIRHDRQKRMLNRIRESCTIRQGRLMQKQTGYVEKGVDVLLTVDMLRLARLNGYDTAILVSGDGDFVDVVKEVREMDKRVELAAFPFGHSWELKKACDDYIEITDIMIQLSTMKTLPENMMEIKKLNTKPYLMHDFKEAQ